MPEYSVLYPGSKTNDFSRSYMLNSYPGNDSVAQIAEKFKSALPGWIFRFRKAGSGSELMKPLLETPNETILGTNLKNLEWRISIVRDQLHFERFHFSLLINFNTFWAKCRLWPVSAIGNWIFIAALRKLAYPAPNS